MEFVDLQPLFADLQPLEDWNHVHSHETENSNSFAQSIIILLSTLRIVHKRRKNRALARTKNFVTRMNLLLRRKRTFFS